MSKQPRSSRQRYRAFVQDYTQRRLDDGTAGESQPLDRGKRRAYVRDYLRWLRPYRYAAGALLALALLTTGLQMIEPLFMRFIIARVLLNTRSTMNPMNSGSIISSPGVSNATEEHT